MWRWWTAAAWLLAVAALPAAAAAAAEEAARCSALSLLSSRAEHGQQHSRLAVAPHCSCDNLTLWVRLDVAGFAVNCSDDGTWHWTHVTVPVQDSRADLQTVVAGCYQARAACRCRQAAPQCAVVRQQWFLPGLELRTWNLLVTMVQMPGLPLRLDVLARPRSDIYFGQLEMRLYRCSDDAAGCDRRWREQVRTVAARPQARTVFGAAADRRGQLTAGRYQLEVRPAGSWVCQGNNNGCRTLVAHALLTQHDHALDAARLRPGDAGENRFKALHAVVGITLALAAVGLIFVWRECAAAARPRRQPESLPVKTTPSPSSVPTAQVLLVHQLSAPRAGALAAQLRAAGLRVADCQERQLADLFRAMPVSDVLATERLQRARLLIVCTPRAQTLERAPAAAAARDSQETLFAAVLRHVRNSTLATDYRRVFVVLADGAEQGLEPLVAGCRFRWPDDSSELLRQLSLSSSDTADADSERSELSL